VAAPKTLQMTDRMHLQQLKRKTTR